VDDVERHGEKDVEKNRHSESGGLLKLGLFWSFNEDLYVFLKQNRQ
jgi:hypothetical protein